MFKNSKIFIICRVQFTLLTHFSVISQELLKFLTFHILERTVLVLGHQENKHCFSLYFQFILLIEQAATTQDTYTDPRGQLRTSHSFWSASIIQNGFKVEMLISWVGLRVGCNFIQLYLLQLYFNLQGSSSHSTEVQTWQCKLVENLQTSSLATLPLLLLAKWPWANFLNLIPCFSESKM